MNDNNQRPTGDIDEATSTVMPPANLHVGATVPHGSEIRSDENESQPNLPETPELVRGTSRLTLYARRFMRNKGAVIGSVIFGLLALFAAFGGLLTPWSFTEPDFLNLSSAPSSEHWFGTTDGGQDLFAQAAHGLGRSLIIGVSVALSTTIISAIVGAGAALLGGWVEKIILAIIHFLLAVPSFLILALLVSDSGGDWKVLIFVMILLGWMYSARVIWSLSISVRENDFVRAARYMGVSKSRIIVRHMLPNISSLLVIQFVLGTVSTVMGETGLSFLGLGVKLPDVSLGTLLSGGTATVLTAPWQFYIPATILTLLTVSLALIADGLRDAIDPNSKSGGNA
ncbi:ABC transporter permease [Corynebacterium sp. ES2794-CONJ1]|uniref:ABC transporter permease n=1 Tax=Corynebacterium sp. ES2794-CONJ1 TaxID=2980553 RepID=UPI0021D94F97|nr:ABC transporter permease [Corynebacterium sp. ES2794-CONJ1]MCU9518962.1 ABC transporter permease [Corynebacterium sp. ES2794-CONJ1]